MSAEADILTNLVTTLEGARTGGNPVFAKVMTSEDLDAFLRVADPLPGAIAGVISRPAAWGDPHDNAEDHVEKLEFVIAMRLTVQRGPGQDDAAALAQMHDLVSAIRSALRVDEGRGGLAEPIRFEGRFMRATDLRGQPKLEAPKKGHAFYAATMPVLIGRRVER